MTGFLGQEANVWNHFQHFGSCLVRAHLGRPVALPTAMDWGEELLDRAVRHWPHGPGRRYMSARDRATPDRPHWPGQSYMVRTGPGGAGSTARARAVPH